MLPSVTWRMVILWVMGFVALPAMGEDAVSPPAPDYWQELANDLVADVSNDQLDHAAERLDALVEADVISVEERDVVLDTLEHQVPTRFPNDQALLAFALKTFFLFVKFGIPFGVAVKAALGDGLIGFGVSASAISAVFVLHVWRHLGGDVDLLDKNRSEIRQCFSAFQL